MIKAVTTAGNASNVANVLTAPMTEPDDVTGFKAIQSTTDHTLIRLSWDAPISLDVSYYVIKKDNWDTGEVVSSCASGVFFDTTVADETEQTYLIKAVSRAGKTDSLEIVPGANIAITPDATNDRLIVAVSGAVPNATNAATAAACTGNAATASKIQTPVTINGVSFDGSQSIFITAPANGGTSAACSGNAATATKLQTPRTISLMGAVAGSGSFDGSGSVAINTVNNNIYIVESGSDSNYYWRKWSDGTIEQWGRGTGCATITFPVTFPNSCFWVSLGDGESGKYENIYPTNITTSGFIGSFGGRSYADPFYYYAIGR
jgi:hypothetical protein